MQAGWRVVLEKPSVSILESNFGQRAIANLRKNCPVARQGDAKQGAEREANKRAVANRQDAPARVRGRDVPQSGHSTQSCLTGVFAAGHWISYGIGFKALHLLGKKLLRFCHGLAFDLPEVDLAQTIVDVRLESCRDRSWGRGLTGTIQWRAPDRDERSLGCPGAKSFGLRMAAGVQRHIGTAGIAVLSMPDRRPVPSEEKMRHGAALW